MPLANERPPFQGVPRMEDAAEDPVGGSAEGDREVEEPVEDPATARTADRKSGKTQAAMIYMGRMRV